MNRICKGCFPYGYGIMKSNHNEVKETINQESKKGPCIGTLPVCIPETFAKEVARRLGEDS